MTILVVDDSRESLVLIENHLKKSGYSSIQKAESGEEALEILSASTLGENRIDLVLLDILMPGMTGIETCQKIKEDPALKDIPIIMVSALTESEYLEGGFNAGALDYIVKPIKKIELLVRVRSILMLKEEMDRRKEREKALLIATEELRKANEELERLSTLDSLTGVPNRRQFEISYEKEWRRSMREKSNLSLLMIDIDYFKGFNDTYGHLAGDEALKKVAAEIAAAVKRPGDLAARYGGEEFVLILAGTDEKRALDFGEKLRAQVEALDIPHSSSLINESLTLSLGVATKIPEKGMNSSSLVKEADEALYRAKKKGRNRVEANSKLRSGSHGKK